MDKKALLQRLYWNKVCIVCMPTCVCIVFYSTLNPSSFVLCILQLATSAFHRSRKCHHPAWNPVLDLKVIFLSFVSFSSHKIWLFLFTLDSKILIVLCLKATGSPCLVSKLLSLWRATIPFHERLWGFNIWHYKPRSRESRFPSSIPRW